MANIFEIAFACGVRFYPESATPGKHFDDDWLYNRLLNYETKVNYFQKWQKDDVIPIQALSTFSTVVFKIYNLSGSVAESFNATLICQGPANAYGVYHANIELDSLSEGIYFIIAESTMLASTFRYISEPISVKTKHIGTSVFKYSNTFNDFGIVFTATDLSNNLYQPTFLFRCEAAIKDFLPQRVRSSYQDQILNVTTLSATPYRQFKLFIGNEKGVAPWVLDLLNRIFCCDTVLIDHQGAGVYKQYETPDGAKWETNLVNGYPLMGGDIDLVEAKNQSSLQQSSDVLNVGDQNAVYLIDNTGGETGDSDTDNIIEVQTTE